jgi:hypothetical protein
MAATRRRSPGSSVQEPRTHQSSHGRLATFTGDTSYLHRYGMEGCLGAHRSLVGCPSSLHSRTNEPSQIAHRTFTVEPTSPSQIAHRTFTVEPTSLRRSLIEPSRSSQRAFVGCSSKLHSRRCEPSQVVHRAFTVDPVSLRRSPIEPSQGTLAKYPSWSVKVHWVGNEGSMGTPRRLVVRSCKLTSSQCSASR